MSLRCKILKGRKRFSVKNYPEEKALKLEEEGEVEILDRPEQVKDYETCAGTTAAGKPCGKQPVNGSDFCRWHGPEE